MRPHKLLPPARLVAPGGPVSAAIRAMRADEPASDYTRLLELRKAISDRIEADLALLDAIDGDPDFEDGGDAEPAMAALVGGESQSRWAGIEGGAA
ncbi:MAG: hypothetical protein PGN25_05590 [Methylorubrum populi]